MYWSPNCVFIIIVLMVPTPISTLNEVTKILDSSVTSGSRHASGNGTTRSGGIDPFSSMQGPLPTFNLDLEFF
jgi:hypothetical protein